jgi:hypothetical protein
MTTPDARLLLVDCFFALVGEDGAALACWDQGAAGQTMIQSAAQMGRCNTHLGVGKETAIGDTINHDQE